ncbi:uncharacterized protein H6S33_008010 [Morchella sextelata]|jgi:hypothetical protein|uniref:uncharacterized protein n=1 Tax=Morchella sextelata TaxID=1174677 RepID=UPI001D04C1F7|nr:uncharacterized protein H6S33_008010 [Morchella sextelata]KAH0603006.1 hypothetical protein H6S33_008010 [Morchella sextelata]
MSNQEETKLYADLVHLDEKLKMLYKRYESGITLSKELDRRRMESTDADEKTDAPERVEPIQG